MSNVLVIGSGSREHVIYEKLSFSSNVNKIWVLPGIGMAVIIDGEIENEHLIGKIN